MPKINHKNYFPENVDITKDGIFTINAGTEAKNLTSSIKNKILYNPQLSSCVKDITQNADNTVTIGLKGKEADFKNNYDALRDSLIGKKKQNKIHYEDYFPELEKVNISEKGIIEIKAGIETQRLGNAIQKKMKNHTGLSLYAKVTYPRKITQSDSIVTIALQGKEDDFKNNYKALREGLIKRKEQSKIQYEDYFPELDKVNISKKGIVKIKSGIETEHLAITIQKKMQANTNLSLYATVTHSGKTISIALKGNRDDFKKNYKALREGLINRKEKNKIQYEDYFPESDKVNISKKGIIEIKAGLEAVNLAKSIQKKMQVNTKLSLYATVTQSGETVSIALQGKEDDFKDNYNTFRKGLIEIKQHKIKYEDYFPEKPDITKDGIFTIIASVETAYHLAASIRKKMASNPDLHFYATVTSNENTVTIKLQGEVDADFKNNYKTLRESLITRKKHSAIKYENHFPEKPDITKDGIFTIIAGVEAPYLAKAIQLKMRQNTDLGFCATVTQSEGIVTVKLEGEEDDDFNITYRVLREGLITRKKPSKIKYEDHFPEKPDTTNENFNKGTFIINAGAETPRLTHAIKFKMIVNTDLHFYANVTQDANAVKITLQGENIEDFTNNYRALREGLITTKKYSEIQYKDYFSENPNISKDGTFTIPAGFEAKRLFIYIQRKMKHDTYLNTYTTITQKDNDVIITLNGKNDEDFQKNYRTIREGLVVRNKKNSSNQATDQMDLETENSLQSIFPPEEEQIEENSSQPLLPPEIEQDKENSSSSPIQPISPSFSFFSNSSRKRKEPDAPSNKLNMLLSDVAQQIDSSSSIEEAATQLNTSPELLEASLLDVNLSYDIIKNKSFQYQYLADNNLLNSLNVDIVIQEETALKKKKT